MSILQRLGVCVAFFAAAPVGFAEEPTRAEAAAALRRAATFFRDEVAVQGGYVWRYSADLTKREGEGKVGPTTSWVQPPATPAVGRALVDAYLATGDDFFRQAARETAGAMLAGQLHSGGWAHSIEFAPEDRRRFAYFVDGPLSPRARNQTSLDDDVTQSSIRFLVAYDAATGFQDEAVHAAAHRALDALLAAQFPNGAWAQGWRGPADQRPVLSASYYPEGEEPTHVKEYWEHYTLNDGVMSRVIETLLFAADAYEDERLRAAALRGGDFLILAQMPEPQPAWAQQYDAQMRPAWARRFEPAAVSGGESQSAIATLMDLYETTGDEKFLQPVGPALEYLHDSLLPDGRLARFYELRTNRPLYFTRQYELTYADDDLPTHYSFQVGSRLDSLSARHDRLRSTAWSPRRPDDSPRRPSTETIRRLIDGLDTRGAWVEPGRLRYWGADDPTRDVIDPRTFANNVRTLARFVGRDDEEKPSP